MDRRNARSLITVLLTLACFAQPAGLRAAGSGPPDPYRSILEKHQRGGEAQALRVRADAQRNRLWVLTPGDVYVYDATKLVLIARVGLPNWSVAGPGFMCAPDLALDRAGTAFVSNNVEPRLVTIDARDFRATEHALTLVSPKQWEIGFGGLAFGQDGTLFGISALAGSIFRIDLEGKRAQEIGRAAPDACELPLNVGGS